MNICDKLKQCVVNRNFSPYDKYLIDIQTSGDYIIVSGDCGPDTYGPFTTDDEWCVAAAALASMHNTLTVLIMSVYGTTISIDGTSLSQLMPYLTYVESIWSAQELEAHQKHVAECDDILRECGQ